MFKKANKSISLFIVFVMIISFVTTNFNNRDRVYADEAKRVDLSIINLVGDKISHETDFWVKSTINAAASIELSGDAATIKNPWIVVTIPKNGGIIGGGGDKPAPQFADSNDAYETKRVEDDENWYVIYKFRQLSGGAAMAFPFDFKFNEEPTRDGDTETIKVDLIDANDESIDFKNMPKLYSSSKTYRAIKQEFEYNNSKLQPHGYNRYDNTTKVYHYNVNVLENQNTTGENGKHASILFAPIVELPKDLAGNPSYVKPSNLKVVVYLPDGVEPLKEHEASNWTYDPATKTATRIHQNPGVDDRDHYRDGKPGKTYWPFFNFKNKELDVPYNIRAEFIVDAGLPTERRLPDRETKIQFDPVRFTPRGDLSFHKDNLTGANSSDPIKYHIDEGHYVVVGDRIYDIENDQTDNGLFYISNYSNSNNGSSFDNGKNGKVTKLYSLGDIIAKRDGDKRAYYKTYSIYKIDRNGGSYTQEEFDRYKQNLIDTINSGNTLFGIKDDGSREVIKRNVQFGEKVEVNDVALKYKGLDLVLDTPIILDNAVIRITSQEMPVQSEFDKFKDGTYTTRQTYGGKATAVEASGFLSDISDDNKTERIGHGHYAYTSLEPLSPRADISSSGDQTIYFTKSGAYLDYVTYGNFNKNNGLWGPMGKEDLENVKLVQLLPPAFNYVAKKGQQHYNDTIGEPVVIENYKNTGRTAVIYTIPRINPSDNAYEDFTVSTTIEATAYADQGINKIESFIIYPKNDVIKPREGGEAYIDELDLDGDGDREEIFMRSTSNIIYNPPREVLLKKQVGFTPDSLGLFAVGDLGEEFFYKIALVNLYIRPISRADIIDKLPYANDTSIAPNESGVYTSRGSLFNTPLTRALEDLPQNALALQKFDVLYQLGPRDTIENMERVGWVTKDQIEDFSKVTSFKLVLKEGKTIETREEVNFLVSSKIPYDKALTPGDLAINSVAMSTGGSFIEANNVKVTFDKYTVTGKYFKDFNKDGNLAPREDGIQGRTVELINADTGLPVVDAEGVPVRTVTDKDGRYTMSVYKRGNYKVRFTRDDTEEFTQPFGKKIDQNNIEEKPEDTNYGVSHSFLLNPISNSAIINGGVISVNRNVEILKTSSEVGTNGVKKVLSGVEFKLMKGTEVIATKETDDEGKIIFENVPFGDYKLVESRGLEGYEILEAERDINVGTGDLPVQVFENKPIKRNITFTKVDADNGDEETNKLRGVRFGLFREDNLDDAIVEVISGDDGVVTFENIPYGRYKIKELETSAGYILSNEIKSVNVTENAEEAIDLGSWENHKIKGNIQVTKVDADDDDKKLDGVVFSLQKDGVEIDTATTNDVGIATFENVVYGDYTILEKTAKEGYLTSDRTLNVSVRENNVTVNAGTVENTIKKGRVTFVKVDAENENKKLSNVKFELRRGNEKAYEAISNSDGVVTFENVVYGSYTLVEVETLQNYNLPLENAFADREIHISEDGQVVDLGNIANQIKKGSVTFVKVDKEDETKKLANVRFELRQNDQKIYEAISNSDGVVTFENVVYGDYKLVEIGTLDSYNLPPENAFEGEEISISADKQVVNLGNITNQIKKGSVNVTKVDRENESKKLSGVTFVLTQDDNEVYEATTNKDGVAEFTGVVYGKYILKEKATLENYNLSTETREVNIDEEGKVVELGNYTNQIKKGSVNVTKVDRENENKKLEGVTFVLVQGDNEVYEATTNKDGVAEFTGVVYGKYILKEKATLENYNLSTETREVNIDAEGKVVDLGNYTNQIKKGSVNVTKVDRENEGKKLEGVRFVLTQDDNEVYEATTNKDGVAEFTGVVYGRYTLKEKATLENYNLSTETREVNIDAEGKVVELGNYTNQIKKGSVNVTKVDRENEDKKLEGVRFVLTQDDNEVYEATTNKDGVAEFTGVVYGRYTLKEKATLENYNLSTETREVNIDAEGKVVELGNYTNQIKKGSVRITKVDRENEGKKLEGVTFVLVQGDKEVYEARTNADGVANFTGVVYGRYTLKEKATLENYNLSDEEREVNIDAEGKVVELGNYTNQIKKGSVRVTKKDTETKEPLSGVVFVLKQGDDEIYEARTNADGIANFEGVIYGEYTLEEKTPLVSHNPTDRVENVNIDAEGKEVVFDDYENTIKKGSVVFTKVDRDKESKTLSGITFVLKQGDNEIYEVTSNADGRVEFTGVKYGVYSLEEKATLENYNLLKDKVEVNIDAEGKVIDLGNISNQIKKGSVIVTKIDRENEDKKLSGVSFVLTQDDEEIYTAITDENGVARFTGVIYGKYILKEKSTLENYNLSTEEREVNIDSEGKVVDLGNYTNQIKKGSVRVTKVDREDEDKKLEGVSFVLTQDDNEVYSATTDKDGVAEFTGVVYGKYILKEKETLENYNLSTETREVNIDEDGKLVDLGNYTNQIKKGSIEIKKIDESKKALLGVEFTLLKDGKELEKKTTDNAGMVIFDNLVYGDYEVVESKALDGYYKNDKVYKFEIRNEGEVLKEEVVNKAIPKKSVKTGDDSDVSTVMALGSVSILSILFLVRKRRYER